MIDLDHVAIATPDVREPFRALTTDAGGSPLAVGPGYGFRWAQVRLGDADQGMTVELLEPWEVTRDDFLARFIARSGPGPHHLTFKVPDITGALERAAAAGYQPVGVALDDPEWKEAFLHPRESHGTVIQLAQTPTDFPPLRERLALAREHGLLGEAWWDPPVADGAIPVVLRRVVIASPSLPAAFALYAGLLGGAQTARGDGSVELTWPGGGCIRIEEGTVARPHVDRLEADGARPRELDVANTRLVIA